MACEFPYLVDNRHPTKGDGYSKVPVPCGKCQDCKMRIASQWALRLRKEDEESTSGYFVTLTYDTDHVPMSEKGYMTLKKSDFQNYVKRLRKKEILGKGEKSKIKYFAVGEYGTKGFRPHYHAIIFNAKKSDVMDCWALDNKAIGVCHVGMVSGASIAYTLKYMMKDSRIPMHQNDDRIPEFRLMSKGLGKPISLPRQLDITDAILLAYLQRSRTELKSHFLEFFGRLYGRRPKERNKI